MQEKLERILKIHPDAVHLGVCTLKQETDQCKTVEKFIKIFQDNGIAVIDERIAVQGFTISGSR